jgi:hypothetical protein
MTKIKENSEAVDILENDVFEVIQYFEKDETFPNGMMTFRHKHSKKIDIVDCVRAYQLLELNGIKVFHCNINIYIDTDESLLHSPLGEITFRN